MEGNMKKVIWLLVFVSLILIAPKVAARADDTPGSFSITSPDDGDEIDGNFTVRWSSASRASYYTISIKNLDTGSYYTELEKVTGTTYSVKYSKLQPGATYRIGLVAYGQYGTKKNGGTVEFEVVGQRPDDFNISTPDDGSQYKSGKDVSISWTSAGNAEYYTVAVRDLTTDRLVVNNETVNGRSYTLRSSKLSVGHEYRVAVTAYNDYGKRSGGEAVFSVVGEQPGSFSISSPKSGSQYASGKDVSISWTSASNANNYVVAVRDLTTNSLIVDSETVNGRSYTLRSSKLSKGHEYRVSVIAVNNQGKRSGGEVLFTVAGGEQPGEFYITSPQNGSQYQSGNNISISWTASNNADYYVVAVRDLTTDSLVVNNEKVSGRSYTLRSSKLSKGHEYRIAVMSYNDQGKRSGGEVLVGVAGEERPGEFNITSPQNGSRYQADNNISISWTASNNADYYVVAVRDLTTDSLVVNNEKVSGRNYTLRSSKLSKGHEYRIAVMSYNDQGKRSGGEALVSVAGGNQPGEFLLTAPMSGNLFEKGANVLVSWTSASNADYYEVTVRDLTTNHFVVDGKQVFRDNYLYLSTEQFTASHDYLVSVTAYNDYDSRLGGEAVFSLNGERPEEFYLATFANNRFKNGEDVELSWTIAKNANYYVVAVRDLTENRLIVQDEYVYWENTYTISSNILTKGHEYCAAVSAFNEYGKRSGGETIFSVESAERPEEFYIIAPEKGSQYKASNDITINWTNSSFSDYYLVAVRDLTTGKRIVNDEKVLTNSYVLHSNKLTKGHEYTIAVSSVNDYGNRSGGESKIHVLSEERPEEFYITTPSQGDKYTIGESIKLSWTEAVEAKYYKVFVRDLTTNELVVSGTKVTESRTFVLENTQLVAGHSYRMAVNAYNDYGDRSGGKVELSVMEMNEKPGQFKISSPINSETLSCYDDIKLEWTKSAGAEYYLVYVRDVSTNKLIKSKEKVVDKTSFTLKSSELIPGHSYKFAVHAYNTNGKKACGEIKVSLSSGNAYGARELLFKDVKYGSDRYEILLDLEEKGIITGNENIEFKPNEFASTRDFLVWLYAAVGEKVSEEEAIDLATKQGLMSKVEDRQKMKRLDAAIILYHFLAEYGVKVSTRYVKTPEDIAGLDVTSRYAVEEVLKNKLMTNYYEELSRFAPENLIDRLEAVQIVGKFDVLHSEACASGTQVENKIVQKALQEARDKSFDQINTYYESFFYHENAESNFLVEGLDIILNYWEYLSGQRAHKNIIKAALVEQYCFTEEEMNQEITKFLNTSVETAKGANTMYEGAMVVTAMFKLSMDERTANEVVSKVNLYLKTHLIHRDGNVILLNKGDELLDILGPILEDEKKDIFMKSNGPYCLSENLTYIVDEIRQGRITTGKQLRTARTVNLDGLSKRFLGMEGVFYGLEIGVELANYCNVIEKYARVTDEQIEKLQKVRDIVANPTWTAASGDMEVVEAIDEIIADLKNAPFAALKECGPDLLKTGVGASVYLFAPKLAEKVSKKYGIWLFALLETGADVANAITGYGYNTEGNIRLQRIFWLNENAIEDVSASYVHFVDHPSIESLEDFCLRLEYFAKLSEQCCVYSIDEMTSRAFIVYNDRSYYENHAAVIRTREIISMFQDYASSYYSLIQECE